MNKAAVPPHGLVPRWSTPDGAVAQLCSFTEPEPRLEFSAEGGRRRATAGEGAVGAK